MKKLLVTLVFGVLVLSMVAGCGQKEEAAAPAETTAAQEAAMTEEAPAMENVTSASMEATGEVPAEAPAEAH